MNSLQRFFASFLLEGVENFYNRGIKLSPEEHEDAVKWVLDVERDDLFSFNNTCEVLKLSPKVTREKIINGEAYAR